MVQWQSQSISQCSQLLWSRGTDLFPKWSWRKTQDSPFAIFHCKSCDFSWGFPYSHGGIQHGWFLLGKIPSRSLEVYDDWGYPYFRKPPNLNEKIKARPWSLGVSKLDTGNYRRTGAKAWQTTPSASPEMNSEIVTSNQERTFRKKNMSPNRIGIIILFCFPIYSFCHHFCCCHQDSCANSPSSCSHRLDDACHPGGLPSCWASRDVPWGFHGKISGMGWSEWTRMNDIYSSCTNWLVGFFATPLKRLEFVNWDD